MKWSQEKSTHKIKVWFIYLWMPKSTLVKDTLLLNLSNFYTTFLWLLFWLLLTICDYFWLLGVNSWLWDDFLLLFHEIFLMTLHDLAMTKHKQFVLNKIWLHLTKCLITLKNVWFWLFLTICDYFWLLEVNSWLWDDFILLLIHVVIFLMTLPDFAITKHISNLS